MATAYGYLYGTYPAIIRTYDQARRTCRIEIPGITSGGDVLPEAEILYPIGDKARQGQYETELEITGSETVWVQFIGGDPRYPIIIGNRNPQTGNSKDWRRYHHKNYECLTDQMLHLDSGVSIHADAGTDIKATAGSTINAEAGSAVVVKAGSSITLQVGGATMVINSSSITMTAGTINLNGVVNAGGSGGGSATFSGPIKANQTITADADVTAGGISLMSHTHTEQGDGAETSEPH